MSTSLTFNSYTVTGTNPTELHDLKKEIFDYHSYYFETENPSPLIFDLGAHIGLATLYFKQLYPTARIIAIEPNPISFSLLQKNLDQNGITDVTCLTVSLSNRSGKQTLFSDKDNNWLSTASFTKGAWTQNQTTKAQTVSAITLKSLFSTYALNESIDFVKMDIEGAEHQVLLNAGSELSSISHLTLEYHPIPKANLAAIATRLQKFGLKPDSPLPSTPKKLRQLQLLSFSR